MIFLLDVNALLAYRYPAHVHHARVREWLIRLFGERGRDDVVLATCPITELGFIRVGSGPARLAVNVETARADLRSLKASENMLFIPDNIPERSPRLGEEARSHHRRLSAFTGESARRASRNARSLHPWRDVHPG